MAEPPGRRIVVHAGFHKTATTTIQSFLRSNGPHLWPHAALILPHRLQHHAARQAGLFSRGQAAALEDFGGEIDILLDQLHFGPKRRLLLSDENLAGRMPGRDGVADYAALPALMARLTERIVARYPAPDLVFFLTTRDPATWLDSLWRHLVRSTRLTEDHAGFVRRLAPAADFTAVIARLTEAVAPYPVVTAAIEAATDPVCGPALPLIDLLTLPAPARAALAPVARANISPPAAVIAEMLALNRSPMDDAGLIRAKARLALGRPPA